MRTVFTFALIFFFASVAAAQSSPTAILTEPPAAFVEGERSEAEADEIETDRDSFTPSTRTVNCGRLVVESAYTYSQLRYSGTSHSYPELLLRYGATERIELRLGWNFEDARIAERANEPRDTERESKLNLGTKVQLTKQKGWVPQSALVLTALVPTSGVETNTLFLGTYVFGWELPNRWKLDAAMRYGTGIEHRDHFNNWEPSIVLKVPVGEKWSVHAEYFGNFTSGKQHDDVLQFFSPGVHYLIMPDFEVGTRVGWGLNDQSARFFANVGLGYRF